MTTAEAAAHLNLTPAMFRILADRESVRRVRVGHRTIRWRRGDVVAIGSDRAVDPP